MNLASADRMTGAGGARRRVRRRGPDVASLHPTPHYWPTLEPDRRRVFGDLPQIRCGELRGVAGDAVE
jgi:hypothetical protein